jgi:hypothetical protein
VTTNWSEQVRHPNKTAYIQQLNVSNTTEELLCITFYCEPDDLACLGIKINITNDTNITVNVTPPYIDPCANLSMNITTNETHFNASVNGSLDFGNFSINGSGIFGYGNCTNGSMSCEIDAFNWTAYNLSLLANMTTTTTTTTTGGLRDYSCWIPEFDSDRNRKVGKVDRVRIVGPHGFEKEFLEKNENNWFRNTCESIDHRECYCDDVCHLERVNDCCLKCYPFDRIRDCGWHTKVLDRFGQCPKQFASLSMDVHNAGVLHRDDKARMYSDPSFGHMVYPWLNTSGNLDGSLVGEYTNAQAAGAALFPPHCGPGEK